TAKKQTYKKSWAKEELIRLKNFGINTVRLENPPPGLMETAQTLGMMIVPVLKTQDSETILALHEYSNIPYWDIDTENPDVITAIGNAVNALDPYMRPVSYSGNTKIDTTKKRFRMIKIRGRDYSSKTKSACESLDEFGANSIPMVINNFGGAIFQKDDYILLKQIPDVRNIFSYCSKSRGFIGAFIASHDDSVPHPIGIRPPDTLRFQQITADIVGNLFSSFESSISMSNEGKYAAEIKYLEPADAVNVSVSDSGSKQIITKRNTLAQNRTIPFKLSPGVDKTPSFDVEYEYCGGLHGRYHYGGPNPVFAPEVMTFPKTSISLNEGKQATIKVTIAGIPRDVTAEIMLIPMDSAVSVSPQKRKVFIQGNDNVDVPFKISIPGNSKWTILTAVLRFIESNEPQRKSYLPVQVRNN
ncbi:MAG TPA: hypothetical protein PLQ76_06200, partial [bacterium]|nr:hypothetical protein [bacterium]